MKPWLFFSILTILCWACMGFFGRLAARSVPVQGVPLLSSLGGLVVFAVLVALGFRQVKFDWQNIHYYQAILAGIIGTTGTVMFYMAIARGEASRVVPITATYPIVTLLLALLFLGEALSVQKAVGIALAVIGICLISIKL